MQGQNKYRIDVSVRTDFLPDQSDLLMGRFVFAYTITLVNSGNVSAQLISRHWIIEDGEHEMQEVRGLGVVGKQPLLVPGEQFEYTSGCILETPVGTMKGCYQMTAEDGVQFEAIVPEFVLSMPRTLH